MADKYKICYNYVTNNLTSTIRMGNNNFTLQRLCKSCKQRNKQHIKMEDHKQNG